MCNSGIGCICKCLTLFASFVAGIVAGLLLFFFPPTTTVGFTFILLIAAVIAVIVTALALYIANGNASPTLTRCFCDFAVFLIVTLLVSLILPIIILALGATLSVLATAIIGGIAVLFFTAALLTFICFLICLIRTVCNRGC